MKTILRTVFVVWTVSAWAQPPDSLWSRTYGGSSADWGLSVQKTADGGFILGGRTNSFGAGQLDMWLVKTDANGDSLWSRTFGGSLGERGFSVQQTTDGGYVLAGYTESFGAGSYDMWLVKTNGNGDSLWSRTFGGSNEDVCNSVQQTADGGFILGGYTLSFGVGTPGYANMWLVKTDANGDSLWSWTFGGSEADRCESVQQTEDGGFILGGWTHSFGAGLQDMWLVKTDANGDSLWSRTFGGGDFDDCFSTRQTADGGFILGGWTASFGAGTWDMWLVKADSNGDSLWSRTFGGSNWDRCNSVQQTADGGYVLAGYTDSRGAGSDDMWLVKTDANGNSLWDRTFGGGNYDECSSIQRTADNGYVLAGTTNSFGAGGYDMWLVRTGPDIPPPPFRITSPNGGEQWPLLSTQMVTWVSDHVDGPIRIELNRDYPNGSWEILADSTADDNSEEIFVNGGASGSCRVRISLIGDTLSDISDGSFLITTSQGTLRLVRESNPNVPVNFWHAGALEQPDTLSESFRWKNFGSQEIVLLPPLEPVTEEFSVETTCDTLTLAPNEMSTCEATLFYHPQESGQDYDTLLIQTNASNGDANGYVRIPLEGQLILEADEHAQLPNEFALRSVYPNPFNAVMQIRFDVPKSARVELEVYDMEGRLVRTLACRVYASGNHHVTYDAGGLASGTYVVRMRSADFVAARKVVLLK